MFLLIISIANRETRKSSIIGLSEIFNYYPETVSIIDSIAKEHKLKYGVGNYWYAKHTTMFSKEDLRIYTVNDYLSPWFHVTNKNWYFKNGKGKYGNPKFNFILLDNLNLKNPYFELFSDRADSIKHGEYIISIVPEFAYDNHNKPYLLKSE
jgi:hypothetical protein